MKKFSELNRTWFDSEEDINHCRGDMSINWITDGRKLLDEEQLKQWVIEHIKELMKEYIISEINNVKYKEFIRANLINYLMDMFNITEEELK